MPDILGVDEMLANSFEPQRQNLWTLRFPDQTIPAYVAKTLSLPSITTEEIVLDYINAKRYLAGKSEWSTMSMTLHNPIAPSVSQKAMEWFRLCYEILSGRAGYAAFYKKNFFVEPIDPVGAKISSWEIRGAFPTEISFGDLDMSSAEPVEISLTMRFDAAILLY